MTYTTIAISHEAKKRLDKIAAANRRTLGGQVEYWIDEEELPEDACDHPLTQREPATFDVSYPGEPGQAKHVKGFYCPVCRKLVIG